MLKAKSVITALSGLAQEHRLAIFRLLVQTGPEGLPASEVGGKVGLAPSSLSFHLKELVHANLLTSRQEGRFVIYSANFKTMIGVIEFLTANCCDGNPCVPTVSSPRKKGSCT